MPKRSNKTRNIFDEISAGDALAILRLLAKEDAKIARKKNYCMGILNGIYKFENESTSEYKDWAVDAPAECSEWVLDEWKKGQKGVTDEELEEVGKTVRILRGEDVER